MVEGTNPIGKIDIVIVTQENGPIDLFRQQPIRRLTFSWQQIGVQVTSQRRGQLDNSLRQITSVVQL